MYAMVERWAEFHLRTIVKYLYGLEDFQAMRRTETKGVDLSYGVCFQLSAKLGRPACAIAEELVVALMEFDHPGSMIEEYSTARGFINLKFDRAKFSQVVASA